MVEVRREIVLDRDGLDADGRGTPAACSRSSPVPATFVSGSRTAITTRATPASISASVHGGVLPWWLHGSSVV